MEERLFTERLGLPTHHPGSRYGDPVNAAGPARNIAANLLPTLLPEQLATARNMAMTLETISVRAISFFPKNCSRHTQNRIVREFPEEKLKIIRVERNIPIQISDDVESRL